MDPNTAVIIILNGMYYAFALFLISIGLNILYGLMRILNIAHGGVFALSAFFTWVLLNTAAK